MNTTYIIKDNKIYEVIDSEKAVGIEIVDGVAKKTKETIKYDPTNDFPYAFFEIRAKFAPLFEVEEEIEETPIIEEKKSNSKSKNEKNDKE